MEANNKPSGFRETYFTSCPDSFVRPEKPVVRRDINAIQQNFGAPLTVNQSNPIKEHLPFNSKMEKMHNINRSTKKDELTSNQKNKGEFFVDIYKESKRYEITEKPNQVKFVNNNQRNEESFKKNSNIGGNYNVPPPSNEKLARVDRIMNSSSMKSLLSSEINDKHLVKKNTVDREALLQATRNCPVKNKRNSDYKHIISTNGQIIYKE